MNTLRVGTRGSALALKQTELFKAALHVSDPSCVVSVDIIKTRGDADLARPISEMGDKSLFTKELEDALLSGVIDVAVHSGKDLTAALPPGLAVGGALERADRADVFCSTRYTSLFSLPKEARVGSGSIRRRAQLLRLKPDISVLGLRGNVGTRLEKLTAGAYDAVVLAAAGLTRLGCDSYVTERLEPNFFLPAPVQGIIALEYRTDRLDIRKCLEAVSDQKSFLELKVERALLERLEGGCSIPLGASAYAEKGRLKLKAGLFRPDGSQAIVRELEGSASDPAALGWEMARTLLRGGGKDILDECQKEKNNARSKT